MPKARELTEVEKFYIENNPQKSDQEISSQMSGVGPKTISKYRDSLNQKESPEHVTQTQAEREQKVAKTYLGDGRVVWTNGVVNVAKQQQEKQ